MNAIVYVDITVLTTFAEERYNITRLLLYAYPIKLSFQNFSKFITCIFSEIMISEFPSSATMCESVSTEWLSAEMNVTDKKGQIFSVKFSMDIPL